MKSQAYLAVMIDIFETFWLPGKQQNSFPVLFVVLFDGLKCCGAKKQRKTTPEKNQSFLSNGQKQRGF